jgi:hypothetical protein
MFSSLYETCHTNTTNIGATLRSAYNVVESASVNTCNRLSYWPDFGYNTLKLVVSTDPSQGIHRGKQKPLYLFCNSLLVQIQQLTFNN